MDVEPKTAAPVPCSTWLRSHSKINLSSSSLFGQISIRLFYVTLAFAALDILIVILLYAGNENSLAQDIIDIEVSDIVAAIHPNFGQGNEAMGRIALIRSSDETARAVRVFDAKGKEIAQSNADRIPLPVAPISKFLVNWTEREETERGYRITGIRRLEIDGNIFWIALALEGNGGAPFVRALEKEVIEHVALPLVPLSVLLFLFSIVAVRRALAPLNRAVQDVDNLDPAQIGRRIHEPDSPTEVRALAGALNRALDRLEGAIAALREFTANVAHELRTPLSIMTLTIDRLSNGPEKAALERDANDMTRLINQMLDMAHADALDIPEHARGDLRTIAVNVIAQLTPLAISKRREIHFHDMGAQTIRGHAEALSRALRNLVENALTHTPEGSVVDVSAGPGRQITVRDRGPGIPKAKREQIFERFWRGSPESGTGKGLGLGIVLSIVRAHNGSVEFEAAPGGGTLVRISF